MHACMHVYVCVGVYVGVDPQTNPTLSGYSGTCTYEGTRLAHTAAIVSGQPSIYTLILGIIVLLAMIYWDNAMLPCNVVVGNPLWSKLTQKLWT